MNYSVVISECREYKIDVIERSVDRLFEDLGGIENYVKPGQRVLLKCNLLMKKRPEEAVTTHPLLVEAIVKKIHAAGAQAIIGDSPGGPFTENALRNIYQVCGVTEVAHSTGAQLNWNLEGEDTLHPEGKILKKIHLAKMLQDVDVVFSIAKLKTHGMTTYTGAVKNLFGLIPGLLKAEYHFKMPDIKDFTNMLVDIETCVKPNLSIIDGVVGMEGAGPSAGSPREVGLLLASANAHALDYVASSIIGLKPNQIPTIQRALERDLIPMDLNSINIIGKAINTIDIRPFELPDSMKGINFLEGRVPKFMQSYLNKLLQPKPVFNHEKCIGCRECYKHCPPKTIEMVDNKPIVDLSNCIRCFCCQELCPYKAVEIKRPWLGRNILTR